MSKCELFIITMFLVVLAVLVVATLVTLYVHSDSLLLTATVGAGLILFFGNELRRDYNENYRNR